jgi:integrase
VKFLFRVTLHRHDLAAEFYKVREPRKIPPVMSPDGIERLLAATPTLKLRVTLALAYGCGLRAGEVVRPRGNCSITRRSRSTNARAQQKADRPGGIIADLKASIGSSR